MNNHSTGTLSSYKYYNKTAPRSAAFKMFFFFYKENYRKCFHVSYDTKCYYSINVTLQTNIKGKLAPMGNGQNGIVGPKGE